MELQGKLLVALLLTYLFSRLTVRLPNPLRKAWGISLAHLLSLLLIMVLRLLVQGPELALAPEQVMLFVPPQIFWWLLDLLREHGLGFMKRRSGH